MHGFPEFVLLAAALVAVPGPAVTLVVKNAVAHGWRSALAASAGVFAADLVWVAASVAGVTAVIVASETAFAALRLAGAAYLVYLGVRLLFGREAGVAPAVEPGGLSVRRSFAEGVVCDLSNPKTALVFTSVLPQFLDRGATAADVAALGLTFAALGALSLLVWAALGAASRRALALARVRSAVMRASGAVLVGFGLRLAFGGSLIQ